MLLEGILNSVKELVIEMDPKSLFKVKKNQFTLFLSSSFILFDKTGQKIHLSLLTMRFN